MLTILFGLGIHLTFLYTLTVSAFELVLGLQAASVVVEQYDHHHRIPNTTIYLSVDALPSDVFNETLTLAGVLLAMSVMSLVLCTWAFGILFYTKCRPWWPNEIFVQISFISTSIVPFAYGAFLVWKYHTMSDEDKALWNDVDPRFMHLLSRMDTLLVLTTLPIVVTVVVFGCRWNHQRLLL